MKPKTVDEAYLQRKLAAEDEANYVIEREAREARRIWKREKHKVDRQQGKKQIEQQLGDEQ